MRHPLFLSTAAMLLLAAGAAHARPQRTATPLPRVWYWHGAADRDGPAGDGGYEDGDYEQDANWQEAPAPNRYFYPGGYDPQYGSAGQVADAADFAARYGCRPVWHAALNRYVPACN